MHKAFIVTGDKPEDKPKGTWRYDDKKKVIKPVTDGKNNANVVALKENELVIAIRKFYSILCRYLLSKSELQGG